MATSSFATPISPRAPLRHVVIRFDPEDAHPMISELCQRERESHGHGEHQHIDFIPNPSR
jgi:hypothetical protein